MPQKVLERQDFHTTSWGGPVLIDLHSVIDSEVNLNKETGIISAHGETTERGEEEDL